MRTVENRRGRLKKFSIKKRNRRMGRKMNERIKQKSLNNVPNKTRCLRRKPYFSAFPIHTTVPQRRPVKMVTMGL